LYFTLLKATQVEVHIFEIYTPYKVSVS